MRSVRSQSGAWLRRSVHEHWCHLAARLLELGGAEVVVTLGQHGGGGRLVRRGRLLAAGGGGLQRELLGALGVEAFEEAAQVLQPRAPDLLRREACEGAARERTLVLLQLEDALLDRVPGDEADRPTLDLHCCNSDFTNRMSICDTEARTTRLHSPHTDHTQ